MARCIECHSSAGPLVEVDGCYLCHGCIVGQLGGAVPERISRGGVWPVYWWWCVCGRQVRRGRYSVIEGVQSQRLDRYRLEVEGVPSAGVMLCRHCAAAAGVPLPLPEPARIGGNLVYFDQYRRASNKQSSSVVSP